MRKPRQQTAVIDIRTGIFVPFQFGFSTHLESPAAKALTPGTCYGQGWTEQEAKVAASKQRQWHLDNGY